MQQPFPLTFHGLRHTYARLALRAGVHPKVVQEVLGHENIGITLDRYSYAVSALEQEAAAKVAALISPGGGQREGASTRGRAEILPRCRLRCDPSRGQSGRPGRFPA